MVGVDGAAMGGSVWVMETTQGEDHVVGCGWQWGNQRKGRLQRVSGVTEEGATMAPIKERSREAARFLG